MAVSEEPTAPIGTEDLVSAGEWRIGQALVSFGTLHISRAGEQVRLAPKAMAVLLALARRAGQTISRDQLMDMVWPTDYPTQDVLSHAIRELRRALGDRMPHPQIIATVPRVGYRLCAEVSAEQSAAVTEEESEDSAAPLPLSSPAPPEAAAVAADTVPRPASRLHLSLGVIAVGLLLGAILAAALVDKHTASAPAVALLTSSLVAERMPSLAPDGERLVYVEFLGESQRSRIVLTDLDGNDKRSLSEDHSEQDLMPMWSRDGSRLVYQSIGPGGCSTMLLDIVGMEVIGRQRLGDCPMDVYDPMDWAQGDRGLWMTRSVSASNKATQLVFRDLQGNDHPLRYQRAAADYDLEPRQSPDGRWLAFRRGVQPQGEIYLIASEGGAARRLTRLDTYLGRFDWYPDSQHLLISARVDGSLQLFKLNVENLQRTALGIQSADGVDLSEASGKAVFERVRLNTRLVELALDDAQAIRQWLVPSTGNDRGGVYSPDGDAIAFVSDRSGTPQVWVIDSPGAPARRLTDFAPANLDDLAWSSDGSALTVLIRADQQPAAVAVVGVQEPVSVRKLNLPDGELRSIRLLSDRQQLAYTKRSASGWSAHFVAVDGRTESSIADLDGLDASLHLHRGSLYFTDPAKGEILRSDPPYSGARVVLSGLPKWLASRWRPCAEAICYIWTDAEGITSHLYKAKLPGPLVADRVMTLGDMRSNIVFELNSDGTRALFRQFGPDQTDIGIIDLNNAGLTLDPVASHSP